MKFSAIVAAATTALMAGQAQAVWCEFYTDSGCTKAVGKSTSYNSGDSSVFSNSGDYVQCHRAASSSTCNNVTVARIDGGKTLGTTTVITLSPTFNQVNSLCYSTGGNGPQYKLTDLPEQQSCFTS